MDLTNRINSKDDDTLAKCKQVRKLQLQIAEKEKMLPGLGMDKKSYLIRALRSKEEVLLLREKLNSITVQSNN